MNIPLPVTAIRESDLHPTVPFRSNNPLEFRSSTNTELSPDAVEHWADLLPAEFIAFLRDNELLSESIEDLLEKLENDTEEVSPRQARIGYGITEGIERLKKIQKVSASLYASPDNQRVEEVIAELHLPPQFKVKFLSLLKQKGIKTLLDVYIMGVEALNSGNFPDDTMLMEDEICYLYDRITLLYLSENAILLAESEDDEEDDSEPAPAVHHHHHRHGIGLKMSGAICAAVLAILAYADYIKIDTDKITRDISKAVYNVIGPPRETTPINPSVAPDTQNPSVEK